MAWSASDFLIDDPSSGAFDLPSNRSIASPSAFLDITPKSDEEMTGGLRVDSTSIEFWLGNFAPDGKSSFDATISQSPWVSVDTGTPASTSKSRMVPDPPSPMPPTPAKHPSEFRSGLLTPASLVTAGKTSHSSSGSSQSPQLWRDYCLCLQQVTFLVHELESSKTECIGANLALHKEAVEYGRAMLLCPACPQRPENLTLLTFLSERLVRLGETVVQRYGCPDP